MEISHPFKPFCVYFLGARIFSYIFTVNYLNQEIEHGYDTATAHSPPSFKVIIAPVITLCNFFPLILDPAQIHLWISEVMIVESSNGTILLLYV